MEISQKANMAKEGSGVNIFDVFPRLADLQESGGLLAGLVGGERIY